MTQCGGVQHSGENQEWDQESINSTSFLASL